MLRTFWLGLFALLTLVPMPAAELQSLDDAGFQKLLKANTGKVLVVNFWATWCAPCRKEMPELVALAKRLGPNTKLILISADEAGKKAEAAAFLTKLGYTGMGYNHPLEDAEGFINSIDPNWGGSLPATILYNKQGKKVKIFTGEVPLKQAEAELKKLQ